MYIYSCTRIKCSPKTSLMMFQYVSNALFCVPS